MKKVLNIVLKPFSLIGSLINKIISPIFFPSKRGKIRLLFVFILILVLFSGTIDYPKYYNQSVDWIGWRTGLDVSKIKANDYPFHLGLDLQGGTHLVYEADVSGIEDGQKDDSVEGVRDVIERRVNLFGVSEPLVQTNRSGDHYRIIVELAGVSDVNEAINMIGETPLLEFKEQAQPKQLTEEEEKEVKDFNEAQKNKSEEVLEKLNNGSDFDALVVEYSEDDISKSKNGDLGFVSSYSSYGDFHKKVKEEDLNGFVDEVIKNRDGYNIIKIGEKKEDTKDVDGTEVAQTEVKASHLLICWKDSERCDSEMSKEEAKEKIDGLKSNITSENFEEIAKENSTDPSAKVNGGSLGWFGKSAMVKEFADVAFPAEKGTISDPVETQFGYHLIYKEDQRPLYQYQISRILLKTKSETSAPPTEQWQDTGLTGKQLDKAQVVFDPNSNQPQISIKFDKEGEDLFAQITERNIDKPVAIFLDKEPISIPRVNEAIKSGEAVISGSFTIPDAKKLAQRLNSGALPVPINLLSQQTVGATLGQDSVKKSLKAGIIGLIGVMIFMLLYYRLPGLLAILALGSYILIVLALFKLLSITLTLAGIAGFILSIGMAVDANVLVFERLKEELKSGKPLQSSIEDGFKRAWPSIRDGNASTLITCFILFQFGTSVIKGFAVTLTVGILASLFSAIIIIKVLLKLVGPWFKNNSWIFGGKKVN